jgi:hypothetical protein
VLVGQVVGFGAVDVGVEQLPVVLVEVAEADRDRAVLGDRLPALVPDAPGAEHLVVLGLLGGGRVGRVEAVAHRHARERHLVVAVDDLRHLHAAAVEDRRDDVGAVVVLVADLAPGP